jgi:nucleotide-binding universal stress UspA family protein
LELHEIEADYLIQQGTFDSFLAIMRERQINITIMGGYGSNALKEVFLGSAVNYMLRNSCCPLLICR